MANSRWLSISLVLIGIAWAQSPAVAASISLSWADMSSNEDGFRIERKASGGNYAQIATVGANVKSYTDSGVTAGVSYCYLVKAFNSAGASAPSNSACATSASSTSSTTSGSSGSNSISINGTSTSSGSSSTIPASYTGGKWKDYTVNLTMKSLDNDAIGVIFRYVDNNNYYRFVWNSYEQHRRIEKRENGVLRVLAENKSQYEKSKEYRIQIAVQGSQIKVWINGGTPVFSVTDGSFLQGTIGLYSSSNKGSIFDDIVVTDLISGQTLLSDNFNDGDYTGWTILDDAGTNYAPSGWVVSNGKLIQTSNIGVSDNSIGTSALYTKGSWTDYTVTVDLTSRDDDSIGVIFRYNDTDNYYRFFWDAQEQVRRVETRVNGDFATLAEDAVPYVPGRNYEIRIIVQGARLQIAIDGQNIFSVTDSTFSGGTIALYSRWNKGSVFDNILVQDIRNGTVLLWDDFSDGDSIGWTVIDDTGTEAGPSQWSVQDGMLVQSSNIGSNAIGKLGTFALY
jgi:hypothetical protein